MADIPLASAQIIWTLSSEEALPGDPPVKVVGIPGDDDSRYLSSWGACNQDFNDASNDRKLALLLSKFVDLTINDGIAPQDVHNALMVIPEYRQSLNDVGGIDPDLV
ncbi:MAG TPA: hypothetical protein VM662_16735 [Sphingomonas sp.]|nr:hypothetical protein [Sphingomonas sp.]